MCKYQELLKNIVATGITSLLVCSVVTCLTFWYGISCRTSLLDRVSQQLSTDWWEEVRWGNLNEEVSLTFLLRLGMEGTENSEQTIFG